jgi:serine protease Do
MTPIVVLTCLALAQQAPQPPTDRPSTGPAAADIVASIESVMADAIARAEPSVVAIHRDKNPGSQETLAVRGRKPSPLFQEGNRFDIPVPRQVQEDFMSFDFGSGVVIGDQGEILTAFHVVRGAARLRVRAVGGQSFEAVIIAADPRSDLAVIAPDQDRGADPPRLKPIPVGDATRLRKGSFLIALGNPFNAAKEDGSPSASWGILSNFARRLDAERDDGMGRSPATQLQNFPTLLQLDAKLNLGMSGGAVINMKGELVGLTTTASSPAGFDAQAGYAIPMDRMGRRAVETLKQGKEVEYGLLGIKSEGGKTNRVNAVYRNSPAGRGHLQVNDEIIAVNDGPIADFESLILAINAYAPGDSVRLKIRRSDEIIERTVVLAKYPMKGEVIATNRPRPWRGLRVDYTAPVDVPAFGADLMDASAAGVIVTDVEESSPAAAAGLKKGVLILRVADHPIQNPREFADAVAGQQGPVLLETDIGQISVGTIDTPRPKPAAPSRSVR